MPWIPLASLPDQKVADTTSPDIIYWQCDSAGRILHQGRVLRQADADSFEVWLPDDGDSAVLLGRDGQHVWYGWSMQRQIERAHFARLGDYWRDSQSVYIENETSITALKDANPVTFVSLGNGYAHDGQQAWYWGRLLKNCSHPARLQLVDASLCYASDGQQVYHDGAALRGVDAASWRLLPQPDFSRDAASVFFGSKKLPRARADDWQHICRVWSKTSRHVYYMHMVQADADPATWDKARVRQYEEQEAAGRVQGDGAAGRSRLLACLAVLG